MPTHQVASRIPLRPMSQLAEAVDSEDDWTGVTDAASRRKRQNRLNVRAYRRRKALESKPPLIPVSKIGTRFARVEPDIPCWVEDQQMVSLFPKSVVNAFNSARKPLIPFQTASPQLAMFDPPTPAKIIFPLSSDHLIILQQYNVLRASLTNRYLISGLKANPVDECSSVALHVLPYLTCPQDIPPALHPTVLQQTIPHEGWVDIIPHPVWRDNVLRAIGTFDEDDLWSDTVGGLFEGFPDSEVEKRGVIAWSPPWHISGWEVSEGFWKKWGWSFTGCDEILEATNRWRKQRGEKPLVFKV